MLTVKCVTMQKDEAVLLEPWLRYHGHLFGFENLLVIDNGSVLPDVLATLDRYERVGVTVYRQFGTASDYMRKGQLTADAIRILDHQTRYDMLLPLDCDEFVALWQITGVACDRRPILDYLAGLPPNETHFRINNCLYNDPSRPGWYWPQAAVKSFMRSNSIQMLDHGYHTFSERAGFAMAGCELTHLHFHHKAFETLKEHTRWKLQSVVDLNDEAAVRAFTGPGVHLLRNLFTTAAEYHRQFSDHLTMRLPEFSALMTALGVDNEMMTMPDPYPDPEGHVLVRLPRDAAEGRPYEPGQTIALDPIAYRDANFDLAAVGENPLRHFVLTGYREQRPLA